MNWIEKLAQDTQRLYHGSQKKFPVDFILRPQSSGYVHDEKIIENIVEKYRPSDKISRFESVFMVDDIELIDYAGGYEDYVYLVEPIGQVDKSDLSWYSDIEGFDNDEEREYALNYWNEIPNAAAVNSLWEYRARQARIISLVA